MIQNDGCPPAPLLEYQARLAARAATRDALNASDTRFAHARLATLASTVLLVVVVWRGGLSVWWLIVPAALLAWLARRHDRVFCDRSAAIRGIAFYERGLARLEDRWAGRGETGERFRDDHHVYANDLDLFGRASLFELLSLARTRGGEEMLAGWLTSPADAAEIRTRQAAVAELGPALDLRERLALAGASLPESVDTGRLLQWAESPFPATAALRLFTRVFTAALPLVIVYVAVSSTWWPLAAAVFLEALAFSTEPLALDVSDRPGNRRRSRGAGLVGLVRRRGWL
jgi:hypothetical protein